MDDEEMDNAILWRLCNEGPWAVAELERELGRGALDGVGRLIGRGLAYRLEDQFVIASAAGRHAHSLNPTR
jgi:hypothetical protein